jgi:cytochrome c553
MAEATDSQVQAFADQRIRVRAEQMRALIEGIDDDIASIGDVYERLTKSGKWNDARTDGPPHLLTGDDILAVNALYQKAIAQLKQDGNFAVLLKACVRPSGG